MLRLDDVELLEHFVGRVVVAPAEIHHWRQHSLRYLIMKK